MFVYIMDSEVSDFKVFLQSGGIDDKKGQKMAHG